MDGRKRNRADGTGLVGKLLRRVRHLATAAAVGIGLAGCTPWREYIDNGFKVGPNYGQPPAPVANTWIDPPNPRLRADTEELSRWWTVFHDPILDSLVCTASKQNLSLKEAGFRILQARAELGISEGLLFPQSQAAQGGYTRKGVSTKVANRVATPQRWFDTWAGGFALGWEIDFWGKYRRSIESFEARLDASVEDYDAVLVTLLGDIASNYVQMRVAEKRLELIRTNIALQEVTLGIATSLFKGGKIDGLDPDQAESTLEQTRALVPQEEVRIRHAANRLCILLGMPPVDLQKKLGPGGIPSAPPDVGIGIPCQVLMNRPDVRKAERDAAAVCARIGVAEADLYPAVSIVGTLGYAAQDVPQLFDSRAFYGTIGPAFQWNILHYGRIVNHIAFEDARFQEKVTAFQNTVLKANEEAENYIISFLKSHQRVEQLQKAVTAEQKAVEIAVSKYKNGTVDFNRVSVLEQNLVQQQDNLAQAQGEIALALIGVYRALGGGWEIRLKDCDAQAPVATLPSATGAGTPGNLSLPKKEGNSDRKGDPDKEKKMDKDKDGPVSSSPGRLDIGPRLDGQSLPDIGEAPPIRTQSLPPRPAIVRTTLIERQ